MAWQVIDCAQGTVSLYHNLKVDLVYISMTPIGHWFPLHLKYIHLTIVYSSNTCRWLWTTYSGVLIMKYSPRSTTIVTQHTISKHTTGLNQPLRAQNPHKKTIAQQFLQRQDKHGTPQNQRKPLGPQPKPDRHRNLSPCSVQYRVNQREGLIIRNTYQDR